MKVCHFITGLAEAGAQQLLLELVNRDVETEYAVCYLVEGSDALVPDFRAAGTEVISLEASSLSDAPLAAGRLLRLLRDRSFDVLHLHLAQAIFVGRAVGAVAGPDTIVTTHHNGPDTTRHRLLLERATMGIDDATIAVSEGVRRGFVDQFDGHDWDDNRWHTIYNGIDVTGFARGVQEATSPDRTYPDSNGPVFLNVGRYVTQKRQTALIHAMADIVDEMPTAELFVVGSKGPLEEQLRTTARNLGLTSNVHVTGRVPDIHAYYSLADVFVLPSEYEGLPMTLVEAMAAGLPIVATDIPGVREAVIDGENGRLVPPESHDTLVDRMLTVSEPSTRASMGEAGRDRARNEFDIEQTAAAYRQLYGELSDD